MCKKLAVQALGINVKNIQDVSHYLEYEGHLWDTTDYLPIDRINELLHSEGFLFTTHVTLCESIAGHHLQQGKVLSDSDGSRAHIGVGIHSTYSEKGNPIQWITIRDTQVGGLITLYHMARAGTIWKQDYGHQVKYLPIVSTPTNDAE